MTADKVGILIVSKCLSSAAVIDTFARSEKYRPEFYVAEKQRNPFNYERAKIHQVIPDLNIGEISKFAKKHSESIAFGLTDTEDFVINGGRDILEKEAGVKMICVTKKYAIESSKADQRVLFERLCPEVNPRYMIFDPLEYGTEGGKDSAVADLKGFSREIGKQCGIVIKPDAPARGAGVGVWGSDFHTEEEMVRFFLNVYSKGRVVVEERIEGEESSFHAFSDGNHFVAAPLARDYKRALENGEGNLTGGMGSYRGPAESLPFLPPSEWDRVVRVEHDAFRRWKGRGSNPELRGIVLYDALMHCAGGFKVLERNSRGGNTEQINLLTTMEDDFVDVCYHILDGDLKGIRFSKNASVATCAVPLGYGVPDLAFSRDADRGESSTIDLSQAYALQKKKKSECDLRIFPMDVRLGEDGDTCHLGTSRSVAVVGIAGSISDAREISFAGMGALKGPLRYRKDLAGVKDIQRSTDHLCLLRGQGTTQASRGLEGASKSRRGPVLS